VSDFVDFNKRDVSLPPGCKDLIDLLKPGKAADLGSPGKVTAQFSQRESLRGTVLELAGFMRRLYGPGEEFSTLSILPFG